MENKYASIIKPWMENYKDIKDEQTNANMSLYQMLEKCANEHLNLTAMWMPGENYKGGLKLNYKNYLKECKKIACSFKNIGVKNGEEIIPILLPNVMESRCSIYGLNYAGGISYPIIPSLPASQLEKILIENSIDKVVMFSGFYEKYKKVLDACHVHCVILTDGTGMIPNFLKKMANLKAKMSGEKLPFDTYTGTYSSNILTWDEFIKCGAKTKLSLPYYKKGETAVIMGTSGTTGIPKGTQFTNESINYQYIQHYLADLNYEKGDKILDILIQSISYGFSVMHYSGCLGLTSIMIPNLVTEKIADLIKTIDPQHFTGGPIHCEYIKDSLLFKNNELKPLKNFISGGAKLAPETEKELNKNDVFVKQGFGTTECLGGATGPKGEYQFGSLGIPLPLTNMGIFKPGTDEELEFYEHGEICVSGPTIMKAYLNNDEETKKALKVHKDNTIWLHTKDIGYCTPDGHFFFEERMTDVFQRCGFNIHPGKIAEFLNSLEYVSECHVLGVKHATEQVVPVAVIVLKNEYLGQEKEIEEKIHNACYNNLDEFAIPYDFIFTTSIPRNLGGKVVNSTLIEQFNLDYSNNLSGNSIALQRKM